MYNYESLISLRKRFDIEFEDVLKYKNSVFNVRKLFNCLLRAAPKDAVQTPEGFLDWFLSKDVGDMIEINNMGPKSIVNAQNIQRNIRDTPGMKQHLLRNCTDLYNSLDM